MDLFDFIRTASLSGKLYAFVIVDDYSHYTWILFLTHKNEDHKAFVKLCKRVQNEKGFVINNVKSDRGRKFDNQDIELYCDQNYFGHKFLGTSYSSTKWVSQNKKDEEGTIVRNKVRLVVQGYNQEEGIDYGETYALVARLEAIRMLFAFACFKDFKLFQMDVKSFFFNGFIAEEVYVEQPPGFENHEFSNHIFFYKIIKRLIWFETSSKSLV